MSRELDMAAPDVRLTGNEAVKIAKACGLALGYIRNRGKGFDRERVVTSLVEAVDLLDEGAVGNADLIADAPDLVWIPDRSWTVLSPHGMTGFGCYERGCDQRAVAVFYRPWKKRTGALGHRREHRCSDHLYGRRVRGGVVEIEVRADSPAAERGFIGEKVGSDHG